MDTSKKIIHLQIEKKHKGHAFIGLGKSMTSADVILIQKPNATGIQIADCHLKGHITPNCTETQNYKLIASQITPNSFKVEVTRPMEDKDKFDMKFVYGVNYIIYSFTDNNMGEKHKMYHGVVPVDFTKKDGGSLTYKQSPFGDGFMPHQHGMIIIWTILADLLILVGKFMKTGGRGFDIHAWSFLILICLSIYLASLAPNMQFEQGSQTGAIPVPNAIGHNFASKRLPGSAFGGISGSSTTTHGPNRGRELQWETSNGLSRNERILAMYLARPSIHGWAGKITCILAILMILLGIPLRFTRALGSFTPLHKFDLTLQRIIHGFFGFLTWVSARVALLTGTSLHEVTYGHLFYTYVVVETVIIVLLFIIFEASYRMAQMNTEVWLKQAPKVVRGTTGEIIQRLRDKGKRIKIE